MINFLKSKTVTGLIVTATVILAGVAIFTASRLYKLGQDKKTTPTSAAKTAEELQTQEVQLTQPNKELAFEIQAQQENSTPAPTPTQTSTPSSTPSPTPLPTNTPTATITLAVTPTPSPTKISESTSLPNAGVGLPTILFLSLGSFLIIFAAVLAT